MKKLIFILLILPELAISQNLNKSLSFAPYFCDKLKSVDNNFFKIFIDIDGFEEAEFFLNPNKRLDVEIKQIKDGKNNQFVLNDFITASDLSNKLYSMLINNMEMRSIQEIKLQLVNKSKVSGFILMDDQTSIILLDPDFKKKYVNSLNVLTQKIMLSNIDKIFLQGNTQEKLFSIIGAIAGLGIGIPVGLSIGKNAKDAGGIGYIFIGPIVGSGIGWLIGYLMGSQIHESNLITLNSTKGRDLFRANKLLPDGIGCNNFR